MQTIKAYKTDDGELFESFRSAEQHQAELDLHAWANNQGICSGGPWSTTMVVDCLIEDAEKVRDLLAKIGGGGA